VGPRAGVGVVVYFKAHKFISFFIQYRDLTKYLRTDTGKQLMSSFRHHAQTDSGVHSASYSLGTRGSYSGGKVAGA
jgi:hypothetical protein